MSEIMKVVEEVPRGLSLVPPIPAASTSELEQKQDSKDLILVIKEEVPNGWSSSLDLQDPVLQHVKEEEEELWISQEEEQLTVKSEDEEKPQLSELQQIKAEDNRETEAPTSSSADQKETEPDRNLDVECSLKQILVRAAAFWINCSYLIDFLGRPVDRVGHAVALLCLDPRTAVAAVLAVTITAQIARLAKSDIKNVFEFV
ncbi:hypothetical protein CRENBAI_011026 [Crenichthys baileyi]|uniref:Uncharacterized protein n=1 Tax=Crenichthys baileyi TaxID=28760 RepID=A0AAV9SLB2_9TELE